MYSTFGLVNSRGYWRCNSIKDAWTTDGNANDSTTCIDSSVYSILIGLILDTLNRTSNELLGAFSSNYVAVNALDSFNDRRTIREQRNNSKQYKSTYHSFALVYTIMLIVFLAPYNLQLTNNQSPALAEASVLMRVCDTREIKTVTSRVCMLYKRTKNSDVRMDMYGNLRITRSAESENEAIDDYSPEKLATQCCKIGCPPHYFAYNC